MLTVFSPHRDMLFCVTSPYLWAAWKGAFWLRWITILSVGFIFAA